MQKHIFLICCGLGLLLLSSCAEDFDRFIPEPATGNIQNFYEDLPSEFVSFFLDNAEENLILLDNSVQLRVPASNFIDASGETVTNIEVRYFSAKKAGDFIQNQITTQDNGREITPIFLGRFEIYKGNDSDRTQDDLLDARNSTGLIVQVPAMQSSDVNIWTHKNGVFDSAVLPIPFSIWTVDDGSTSQEFSGYQVEITNQDWHYLGSRLTESPSTILSVTLPPFYDDVNTHIYAFTNNAGLSVTRHENVLENTFTFSSLKANDQPISLVSISQVGDDFFHLGMQEVTLSGSNQEIVIIPVETSKLDIITFLDSL